MRPVKAILTAALSLALPVAADAEGVAEPAAITIGTTHHLLFDGDETPRQVNVYLPDGYQGGEEAYPVLYLIDGGLDQDFLHVAGTTALNALWGRSRPVIVVGIETRDRRQELIHSQGNAEERDLFPTAGDSQAFRAFIRDQVKPLIEANYRTSGEDGVIGESLAGLFIVETWLVEPDLFGRYAAIDPSLWWQDQALARSSEDTLTGRDALKPILLSHSNEGPITSAAVEMVAGAAGGAGCLLPRSDLTHATAYHVLTPTALQFLFPSEYEFEEEWGFSVDCADSGEKGQG